MRATRRIFALTLISLLAAHGCGGGQEPEQADSDLIGAHKGSVDHAAIVEGTTMMLAGGPVDSILDPYNREDPFAIKSSSYAPTFAKRLAAFDDYDGQTDWSDDQAAAWASRMASANYLVVDTSMPCDFENPHTYLEIERAQLTGQKHMTCGGRMPNEDALDVTLDFLIRGPAASADDSDAIHDGVDSATHPSEDTFPYLAELNGL